MVSDGVGMLKRLMGLVKYIVFAFCVCTSSQSFSQNSQSYAEYWTVEEFHELNPEQIKINKAFVEGVRKPGLKKPEFKNAVKIGIVYPGLQASDYWRRSVASLEGRLNDLGLPYTLFSHFTKPVVNIREQSDTLGEFLESGVDYLIFTLNVSRHKELIEKVMIAGRAKLFLQNITTPLKSFSNQHPFQYVGFDHAIGTQILAEKYLRITGGHGQYAILHGPRGYVTDMRGGTFLREMKKHKNMQLVDSYYVGFDRKRSYEASLEILATHPKLDFIFSSSTDIALGVLDALKETGKLDTVMTNGWGGGSAELKSIEQGELNFTVMRLNDDNGVAMADAISLDQQGREEEVPIIFSGDMVLVDDTMSVDYVRELKKRAFRYSK